MLVVGSCNTDLVVRLANLPIAGQTVRAPRFEALPGGKGANQAVAAVRVGGRAELVARIGRDSFGADALRTLRKEGVGIGGVLRDSEAPTGLAFVCVDRRGENLIAVASGANRRLTKRDIREAKQRIAATDVVVAQLEIPVATVATLAAMTRAAGKVFVLNPAPACVLPRALLQNVSVLTPNEGEACLMSGTRPSRRGASTVAAERLLAAGVGAVVVTRGPRGALLVTSGGRVGVAAHPVKVVDTTGAGDVFNGALAVAIAEGKSLMAAVRFANVAAALSTTRFGAQTAPTRSEIDNLLPSR